MKRIVTTTTQMAALLVILVLVLSACTAVPTSAPAGTAVVPPQVTETAAAPSAGTGYPAPTVSGTSNPSSPTEAAPETEAYPVPQQPAAPLSTPIPANNVSVLPDPAGYTWQTVFSGLQRPTDLVSFGDNSGRMLVLEQPGTIYLVQNGELQSGPFLDIRDRVGSQANEQGLLGLALPHDFATAGFLYVNYTNKDGNTVVARFAAAPDRTNASAESEKVLMTVDQPYDNHNGGGMSFGPDGYLYIGLGDGGSGGDPQRNGQNPNTLLGKLLRIDVNQGDPYTIPGDNAFAGGGGSPEIFATGLRNPWKFSFDRATGDLFIGDVGQNIWEEINFLPAGSPSGTNFGWNLREGANPYENASSSGLTLVDPVAQYKHPEGCSVTGGFVYRGEALADFQGVYLYGDFCNGRIWGLLRGADGSWQNQPLFETGLNISSFGQDDAGELYILDLSSGSVLKLVQR